jgi:hypothetical protein
MRRRRGASTVSESPPPAYDTVLVEVMPFLEAELACAPAPLMGDALVRRLLDAVVPHTMGAAQVVLALDVPSREPVRASRWPPPRPTPRDDDRRAPAGGPPPSFTYQRFQPVVYDARRPDDVWQLRRFVTYELVHQHAAAAFGAEVVVANGLWLDLAAYHDKAAKVLQQELPPDVCQWRIMLASVVQATSVFDIVQRVTASRATASAGAPPTFNLLSPDHTPGQGLMRLLPWAARSAAGRALVLTGGPCPPPALAAVLPDGHVHWRSLRGAAAPVPVPRAVDVFWAAAVGVASEEPQPLARVPGSPWLGRAQQLADAVHEPVARQLGRVMRAQWRLAYWRAAADDDTVALASLVRQVREPPAWDARGICGWRLVTMPLDTGVCGAGVQVHLRQRQARVVIEEDDPAQLVLPLEVQRDAALRVLFAGD